MTDGIATTVAIFSSGSMMNGMDGMMGGGLIAMGFMMLSWGLLLTLVVVFAIWIARQISR